MTGETRLNDSRIDSISPLFRFLYNRRSDFDVLKPNSPKLFNVVDCQKVLLLLNDNSCLAKNNSTSRLVVIILNNISFPNILLKMQVFATTNWEAQISFVEQSLITSLICAVIKIPSISSFDVQQRYSLYICPFSCKNFQAVTSAHVTF